MGHSEAIAKFLAGGGHAFPVIGFELGDGAKYNATGMSMRDWFATSALSAMPVQIAVAEHAAAIMAKSAYVIADAMLKARDEA